MADLTKQFRRVVGCGLLEVTGGDDYVTLRFEGRQQIEIRYNAGYIYSEHTWDPGSLEIAYSNADGEKELETSDGG